MSRRLEPRRFQSARHRPDDVAVHVGGHHHIKVLGLAVHFVPARTEGVQFRLSVCEGPAHVARPEHSGSPLHHRVDELLLDDDVRKGRVLGHVECALPEEAVGHAQHVGLVHDGDAAAAAEDRCAQDRHLER